MLEDEDWVHLEYIGEPFEIMEDVIFEKGIKSGLPKELWEQIKDDMQTWKVIEP